MEIEDIYRLNTANVQTIIEGHPPEDGEDNVWTFEGLCVTADPHWNRTGLPRDSTSWRYTISEPEHEGWVIEARAVWRDGGLYRPHTHMAIECYESFTDFPKRETEEVARLACDYLRGI